MEVIVVEDAPSLCERPRSVQPQDSLLDTSHDAEVAFVLQHEKAFMEADAAFARTLQRRFDEVASEELASHTQRRDQPFVGKATIENHWGGDHGNVPNLTSVEQERRSPRNVRRSAQLGVKLYVADTKSIIVKMCPDAKLASILSKPSVAKALCSITGVDPQNVTELADCIEFHRPAPNPRVFNCRMASRVSVFDAVGESGGVLRARASGPTLVKAAAGKRKSFGNKVRGHDGNIGGGQIRKHLRRQSPRSLSSATGVAGECDGLNVLRTRTPDDQVGSPVVLVKNFNRDRGVLLARLTGLKEMVEMAPEARKKINDNVRNELDSHQKIRRNFTSEVRRASDRVLDLGGEAMQEDFVARSALAHRAEYASTAVLVYDQGTTLPRHVDGCGHWVVLFSFGVTVDFFAGSSSFKFESGDALIFNGSSRHAVMHGIDRVHKRATLNGKALELPEELGYMQDKRASFQTRQGDA
mmetsp:Transcript_117044/g.331256  ORF Transcript_117044/g.331256 Transcript_117044/m.331256 type:complete len:470 (-) Transcript_117044:228-1637(-)